ncbi:MAG: hypothetical protein HN576_07600 [Bacteriovoracaceae bacterium]|jgi:hypothetical protein|nr:hypothetical protein [Bacteriovoracaceae bacterium]
MSVIFLVGQSCTQKTDESLVKLKVESLANDISFKENLVPLKQIFKTKLIIEKYFQRDVQIKLKIRKSIFNISNTQILSQNLFLLNKMIGKLDLSFQDINVEKRSDSKGIYYRADFEIDAIGSDAQNNQQFDEEIKFQFYFRKYNGIFLIYRGQNPDS